MNPFDFSSSSSSSSDTPATPDWLNPDSATAPLESELGNTDKYYNINRYLKHMNQAASAQFGMDLQEGQNAAGEATSRALQNGTQGSVNTSMIAAQTALPGMQAVLNTKAKTAEMALEAGMKNQQARADIAKSIASARSQYSNTLANYISTTRGQNISGFNMARSTNVTEELGNRNADNSQNSIYASILNNPNASADVRAWAKKMIGMGGFDPGYLPNAGAIQSSSEFPQHVLAAY